MNLRVNPSSAGTRFCWLLLALLLPPLATGESQDFSPRATINLWNNGAGSRASGEPTRPDSEEQESRAYLPVVGPPALRFEDPEMQPPKDPSTRPPASPPTPSAATSPAHPASEDVSVNPGAPAQSGRTARTAEASAPPQPAPQPIIPDDGAARVRPEDFLPFFQFPGGNRSGSGDSSVATPPAPSAPPPLPPSSATYRQE